MSELSAIPNLALSLVPSEGSAMEERDLHAIRFKLNA
jgi:hypothetical protein